MHGRKPVPGAPVVSVSIGMLTLGALLAGCFKPSAGAPETSSAPVLLAEVTAGVGIPPPDSPWPDGRYRIPEVSAGGLGLLDADADGDLDIYQLRYPPPGALEQPAPNRLYLRGGDGKYAEAPGALGLDDPGYSCGVAVGDIDGDGDPDVFVANLGPAALYRNDAGRFTNVTGAALPGEDGWSAAAAFLDHDQDGDLDLYVSRYLVDDPSRVCRVSVGAPQDYCGPSRYQGVPDLLFVNQGSGSFADGTAAAGIRDTLPGFGVLAFDMTGDGRTDIYVANDKKPNLLWVNQGGGQFRDEALERGVALGGNGEPEASMGVAAGDINQDGTLDLFVTNLVQETHTLYTSVPGAGFVDRTAASGLGAATLSRTGWGCGFLDLDHDGDLDLAVVNGRIERAPAHPQAEATPFWAPYAEPSQLFLNTGGGQFADASARAGAFGSHVEVGRGLAFGDLDRDGDLDLVTTAIGDVLRVYRNDAPAAGTHWLQVRALTGKRAALGALVRVEAGALRLVRPLIGSYSFSAANEAVAHFGLGGAARVERIVVHWPGGKVEAFAGGPADRTVTVREGEGRKP